MKYYMYVFVMPGLSPEQVAVQAAHAAYEAGYEFHQRPQPHLVLISANIEGIMDYLRSVDIDFVYFEESMFGDPVITSIATYPIEEDSFKREKLSVFSTLRFKSKFSY